MSNAAAKSSNLKSAWKNFLDAAQDVRGVPVIVALLLFCGLLLDGTPQGLDIVQAAAGNHQKTLWIFLATLFLGLEAWFWTRTIVTENCGQIRQNWPAGPILTWVPRTLGFAPFLIAAVPIAQTHFYVRKAVVNDVADYSVIKSCLSEGLFLLLLGAALISLLTMRTHLIAKMQRSGPLSTLLSPINLKIIEKIFQWVSYSLTIIGLITFTFAPVWPAHKIGSIPVVFIGVALIIPVIARAMHFGLNWRAPVLTFLVVYAAILTLFVDNHMVGRRAFLPPLASSELGSSPANRIDLRTAYENWYKQASSLSPQGQPVPIIFISAEGGASRAGYWAAEVLGLLQEKSAMKGRFAKSLFAISSVSGGSVGAAAFISQLHENRDAAGFDDSIKAVAGYDFLSPALAGLLFPDLVQRIVPFPFLPDRAEGLERAFELGWADHCKKIAQCDPNLWSKPFLDLWQENKSFEKGENSWTPVLLINGTRQEDGVRIITSNIPIDPNVFTNAVDFYSLVDGDVRVSTAIHNGARFPLVSPGGTLRHAWCKHGHIIDGGYFDGGGIVTMRDIAAAVLAIARADHHRLKPIFIELNNDSDTPVGSPSLVRGRYTSANVNALTASKTNDFAADLLGPLNGLSSVQSSHGTNAAVSFSQEITAANPLPIASSDPAPGSGSPSPSDPPVTNSIWGEQPTYWMIHLCRKKNGRGMPMDWALSNEATYISAAATGFGKHDRDVCHNAQVIKGIEHSYFGTTAVGPAIEAVH